LPDWGYDLFIALIGLGNIGRRHLHNIVMHARDWGIAGVEVYDLDCDGPREWFERYRTLRRVGLGGLHLGGYFGPGSLTPRGSYDAVLVCTGPWAHFEAVEAFAKASLWFLVEKPLATYQRWTGLPVPQNKVLAAMNLRYHPGVQWLKQHASLRPSGVRVAYDYLGSVLAPRSPERELGPLRSCIHDLDAALWVTHARITGRDADDRPVITSNGQVIRESVRLSCKTIGGHRFQLDGEFGFAGSARTRSLYVAAPGEHGLGSRGIVCWGKYPERVEKVFSEVNETPLRFDYHLNTMYVDELRAFFRHIRGSPSHLPTVWDVLEIARWL